MEGWKEIPSRPAKEEDNMKNMIFVILILSAGLFFAQSLLAGVTGQDRIGVLSETSFVVVKERAANKFVVMLYGIRGEKIELLDVIRLDGLFAATKPEVKIYRVEVKYEYPTGRVPRSKR